MKGVFLFDFLSSSCYCYRNRKNVRRNYYAAFNLAFQNLLRSRRLRQGSRLRHRRHFLHVLPHRHLQNQPDFRRQSLSCGAHFRRRQRSDHGVDRGQHPHPLGEVPAVDPPRNAAQRHRALLPLLQPRARRRAAARLHRRHLHPLGRHLHADGHSLLVDGSGADRRREGSFPASSPARRGCSSATSDCRW